MIRSARSEYSGQSKGKTGTASEPTDHEFVAMGRLVPLSFTGHHEAGGGAGI